MFTVYRPMLSDRGHRISSLVDEVIGQKPGLGSGEQLIELMPRSGAPLDLVKGGSDNWYRWFDLSKYRIEESAIGHGCTAPCGPCLRGNGADVASVDPLPVVVKKMEMEAASPSWEGYTGWYRNDSFSVDRPVFSGLLWIRSSTIICGL